MSFLMGVFSYFIMSLFNLLVLLALLAKSSRKRWMGDVMFVKCVWSTHVERMLLGERSTLGQINRQIN